MQCYFDMDYFCDLLELLFQLTQRFEVLKLTFVLQAGNYEWSEKLTSVLNRLASAFLKLKAAEGMICTP